MGDDPIHVMMQRIIALSDEYQSKENAKRVLHALKENAPSTASAGYRTGSPHPDSRDLCRPPRVQQAQQGKGTEACQRDRDGRGAAADRSSDVERCAGPPSRTKSENHTRRASSAADPLPASVFAPTATGCKGRSIPMETLDSLVAEHPADRLLQPERLEACDRKAICSEPLSPLRAESRLRSAFAILF